MGPGGSMLWPGGGAVYPPWPPATCPCQYCPGPAPCPAPSPAPGTRGTGGGLTRLCPSSHQGASDRSGRGCCRAGQGSPYLHQRVRRSPGLRPREARVKSAGSSATSSFQRCEAGPRMLTWDSLVISPQHYTATPTPCSPPTSHSRPSTAARHPSLTGEVRLARNRHALVPFLKMWHRGSKQPFSLAGQKH